MKKFLLVFLFGFVFNIFAQEIEIQIVPDVEKEMQEIEHDYNEMQFNDSFSNVGNGSYLGYLLNTKPNDILKDACKWKGCKRPISINKQNELIGEFEDWLSRNYAEWSKDNGK